MHTKSLIAVQSGCASASIAGRERARPRPESRDECANAAVRQGRQRPPRCRETISASAASSRVELRRAIASRLAFRFGVSVMSDAVEMIPTGGELTVFEAVDRLA